MEFTQKRYPDQSRTGATHHCHQKVTLQLLLSPVSTPDRPIGSLKKLGYNHLLLIFRSLVYQRIFMLLLMSLSSVPIFQGAVDALSEKDVHKMLSWNITRSKDKRMVVISPSGHYNAIVLRWAEDIRKRVEKLTGIKLLLRSSEIHISVRPKNLSEPEPANSDGIKVQSDNTQSQVYIAGWVEHNNENIILRLAFLGYENIEPDKAEKTLCSLLIYAYALDQTNVSRSVAFMPDKIPSWLVEGIARNLYPHLKVENINCGLKYWYEGKIPSPEEIIMDTQPFSTRVAKSASEESSHLHEYVSGLFVAWLASFPEKQNIFENIFKRLAEQKLMTIDLVTNCIPEMTESSKLIIAWDKWLFGQKYVVANPGTISMLHIDELRNLLLIRPAEIGDCSTLDKQFLSFRDLIHLRKTHNLKDFCTLKFTALKIISAGRDKEFENVVNLYCQFLNELSRDAGDKKLTGLLDKAEHALLILTERVEKQQRDEVHP